MTWHSTDILEPIFSLSLCFDSFWRSSSRAYTQRQTAHTCAPKNTPMSCVNSGLPPFRLVCFSHPVWPAVIIQPINPEKAARHGKPSYLTLVSCWLEVIFSPCGQRKSAPCCCFLTFLLTGASGSHLTDLISLISLRRRQLHNHLTAKTLTTKQTGWISRKLARTRLSFISAPKS